MNEAISAGRLSKLIGLIYDCAIDPGRWAVAMEAIRVEVGGALATLDLVAIPTGDNVLNVMTNVPSPYRDSFAAYAPQVAELWGGVTALHQQPLERPGLLRRANPDYDRLDLPFLSEWFRPQGLGDILGIWLARDAELMGFLGFGRLRRDGPFGEREIELMTLLIPHLQRAAAINRLLDIAALERSTFAALFDSLSVPVLLVASRMRLIHANASARALLEGGGALRERDGLLCVGDIGTSRALQAAVAQATGDSAALERKGLGIPLRHEDGTVGVLHVLPLAPSNPLARSGALAAVFVAQTLTPMVAPTDLFAALFGLTPTEGRVFGHVAAGRSVAQTADALGVEDSTVKTHLLRLYDKTGVRRQAELVHMAASLAVPLAPQRLN